MKYSKYEYRKVLEMARGLSSRDLLAQTIYDSIIVRRWRLCESPSGRRSYYNREGIPNMSTTEQVCQAVDCEEKATHRIEITAGKFGTIVLSVCSKCVGKFQD